MADRGRRAQPISSHACNERWMAHCQRLHLERLANMKSMVDQTAPECCSIKMDGAKRKQLAADRQAEVDLENNILLDKLIRIKNTQTEKTFRPWLGRSTFQWSPGLYYDSITNTKCVDHHNRTLFSSPRSVHHPLHHSSSGMPSFPATQRYMREQEENSKLLRAIEGLQSSLSRKKLEPQHLANHAYMLQQSNYRGPAQCYYVPAASGMPPPTHQRFSKRPATAPSARSAPINYGWNKDPREATLIRLEAAAGGSPPTAAGTIRRPTSVQEEASTSVGVASIRSHQSSSSRQLAPAAPTPSADPAISRPASRASSRLGSTGGGAALVASPPSGGGRSQLQSVGSAGSVGSAAAQSLAAAADVEAARVEAEALVAKAAAAAAALKEAAAGEKAAAAAKEATAAAGEQGAADAVAAAAEVEAAREAAAAAADERAADEAIVMAAADEAAAKLAAEAAETQAEAKAAAEAAEAEAEAKAAKAAAAEAEAAEAEAEAKSAAEAEAKAAEAATAAEAEAKSAESAADVEAAEARLLAEASAGGGPADDEEEDPASAGGGPADDEEEDPSEEPELPDSQDDAGAAAVSGDISAAVEAVSGDISAEAVSGDVDALGSSGLAALSHGGGLDPAASEGDEADEAAEGSEDDGGAADDAEPVRDDEEDEEDLGFESLPPDLDLGDLDNGEEEEEEAGPGPVAEGTAYTSGSLDGGVPAAGSSAWRHGMERPSTANSTASSTTSRRSSVCSASPYLSAAMEHQLRRTQAGGRSSRPSSALSHRTGSAAGSILDNSSGTLLPAASLYARPSCPTSARPSSATPSPRAVRHAVEWHA